MCRIVSTYCPKKGRQLNLEGQTAKELFDHYIYLANKYIDKVEMDKIPIYMSEEDIENDFYTKLYELCTKAISKKYKTAYISNGLKSCLAKYKQPEIKVTICPVYNDNTYDRVFHTQLVDQLNYALDTISPIEAEIIRLRYFGRLSLAEAAMEFNRSHGCSITRTRTWQIEAEGLKKLRDTSVLLKEFIEFL